MTDAPFNNLDESVDEMKRAFRVIPGHPESRVIIHVPHSSRAIPDDVRHDILLDDDALEHELDAMTDSFADVIAEQVADRLGLRPWIFVNDLSRLVVDPERFTDESEEMNAVGMGAIYTRTATGAPLRSADEHDNSSLLDDYFAPYAAGLTELVDQRLRETGEVTIIDLHSFPREALPYELHGSSPRPEICLGTDSFHTTPHLLETARQAFSEFEVGRDSPFAGCYVPLAHYRKDERVQALMIELRRDLYMDEAFQLVDEALEPIVEAVRGLVVEADAPIIVSCPGMFDLQDAPHFEEEDK